MTYIIDVDKIDQTDNAYMSPIMKDGVSIGTQCVALVQAATPAAGSSNPPRTSMWHPGIWIHGSARGTIKKGTVIATFLNNIYPTGDPRHAAVYLDHDEKGITVIDQWAAKVRPSNSRPLTFRGSANRSVDNGDLYYVVELTTLPGQGGPCSPVEGSTGVDQQTLL
jgi:hypothetical protein